MNVSRWRWRVAATPLLAARVGVFTVVGYLGVLTAAAWTARRRPAAPPVPPRRRFAFLVPAHDEERSIERTLVSLLAIDHPSDRYEIHVVADNCTDATVTVAERVALEHPGRVMVHDRVAPDRRGKGPALEWLMGRIADRGHDAYVFVDADTTVTPGFLGAVEPLLAAGHEVVQGHYAVRDIEASPLVAFRAAALAARTFLRPLGRNQIGGSAGLYGNGMVFSPRVLATRHWSDHLVEDIELHLDLLLDGCLVRFAPDAVVRAEMPDSLDAASTQHARWERGRVEMMARYRGRLWRGVVRGGGPGRVAHLDALMDQAVPPLSVVVAASGGWWLAAVTRWLGSRRRRGGLDVVVASGLGAVQVVYVLSALRMTGAPATVYRALLLAPRMTLWKLGLWARALRSRDVTWERTERNS
ncbi:MAG: glycosyltransferase family 2 protein [Desertimonas sp.]